MPSDIGNLYAQSIEELSNEFGCEASLLPQHGRDDLVSVFLLSYCCRLIKSCGGTRGSILESAGGVRT